MAPSMAWWGVGHGVVGCLSPSWSRQGFLGCPSEHFGSHLVSFLELLSEVFWNLELRFHRRDPYAFLPPQCLYGRPAKTLCGVD